MKLLLTLLTLLIFFCSCHSKTETLEDLVDRVVCKTTLEKGPVLKYRDNQIYLKYILQTAEYEDGIIIKYRFSTSDHRFETRDIIRLSCAKESKLVYQVIQNALRGANLFDSQVLLDEMDLYFQNVGILEAEKEKEEALRFVQEQTQKVLDEIRSQIQ